MTSTSDGWQHVDEVIYSDDGPIIDSERYVSYSLDDLYPEWQDKAHCRGVGVNYYFGDEAEQPTMSIKQVRQASKLCDVCPVFDQCLRWALEKREYYGVWAGTSGRTRKNIFRMLDQDETTVDEVVRSISHGKAARYRPRATSGASRGRVRDDTPGEGVLPQAAGQD